MRRDEKRREEKRREEVSNFLFHKVYSLLLFYTLNGRASRSFYFI
jgi:hypothetical protein